MREDHGWKGGEVIVAYSESFKRLVGDIMGADGLRDGAKKTGISLTYLGRMRSDGQVPSADMLAQFIRGYNLDEQAQGDLLAAATGSDGRNLQPETLLHMACQLARLPVSARLRVLECFREQQEAQQAEQAA